MSTFGYRRWRVQGGRLYPLVYDSQPWEPGVTVARCGQASEWRDHLADLGIPGHDTRNLYELAKLARAHADQFRPVDLHGCGLYAYRTVEAVQAETRGAVKGLVLLTGRILPYERMFRAQRGRILALVDKDPAGLRKRLHADYRAVEIVKTWDEAEVIRERWED